MYDFRIGIDLGGTKTEVILMNGASQQVFRHRIATQQHSYAALLDSIVELVNLAETVAGSNGLPLGVGVPGTVTPAGLLAKTRYEWLNGQAFAADLSMRLARSVKVANDANCFALSESMDGAGRHHAVVFAAILGTGCGAGITCERQVLQGANGLIGEWGHNPLPWVTVEELESRHCYCGKRGCLGRFISGTGLSRSYEHRTGVKLSGDLINQRARAGEAVAQQVMNAYMDQLARALASVINVLDPDVIVLGGGCANITELYTQIPQRLPQYVFGGVCATPIVPAVHGDSSGVRGATWLNPLE